MSLTSISSLSLGLVRGNGLSCKDKVHTIYFINTGQRGYQIYGALICKLVLVNQSDSLSLSGLVSCCLARNDDKKLGVGKGVDVF